jgi:hypothetical protein
MSNDQVNTGGKGCLSHLAVAVVACSVLLTILINVGASEAALAMKPTAPKILSVTGKKSFPWEGGSTNLNIRTIGAVACAVELHGHPYSKPHYSNALRSCGKKSFSITIKLNPNPYTGSQPYVFWVLANGDHKTVTYHFTLVVQGDYATDRSPTPISAPSTTTTTTPTTTTATVAPTTTTTVPPPVVDLDACAPGPSCFYGPIYNNYQTWGNTAPADLGDCTFAAAANWEQIVLHLSPNPTVIGYEFSQAGGTATGLAQDSLFSYWEQQGIAGVVASGFNSYYTDQTDVENGVRDYGALIVELNFIQGTYFGQYQMDAGSHDALVDGFTPEGPLVVSWGQTLQMTWAQWTAEVVGMWGVSAT